MVFPTLHSESSSGGNPHHASTLDIESPAFDRPLRIGVMLDSLTAPLWVAKILQDIAAAPFLTLSLVVVDATEQQSPPATWREWFGRQRAAAPYRLWEWYQAADYERFRREGADPFETTDVTPLVREADLLRVEPLRVRFVDRFRPEDVQQVRDAHLDVMLRFGFRIVKGEILEAAPYGMWSLHHDDNRSYRGGPALFWEVFERNPESGTVLQILTDALDGGKVLYRSIGPTNFASVYKNRRATYWKSAEFMMRRLADLHREGWAALQALDTYTDTLVPLAQQALVESKVRGRRAAVKLGIADEPKKGHKLRNLLIVLGLAGLAAFVYTKVTGKDADPAWTQSRDSSAVKPAHAASPSTSATGPVDGSDTAPTAPLASEETVESPTPTTPDKPLRKKTV